jgi:hypothetical protein
LFSKLFPASRQAALSTPRPSFRGGLSGGLAVPSRPRPWRECRAAVLSGATEESESHRLLRLAPRPMRPARSGRDQKPFRSVPGSCPDPSASRLRGGRLRNSTCASRSLVSQRSNERRALISPMTCISSQWVGPVSILMARSPQCLLSLGASSGNGRPQPAVSFAFAGRSRLPELFARRRVAPLRKEPIHSRPSG